LVSTEFAERRNLTMTNPAEGNIYPTVRTLVAAYQMMLPGETARCHRHTPNALRLVLEGTGTYTVVDGRRIEMVPGDVLLTPNWSWHAHGTVGDMACYWLDFLDVPLVHLLEPMFFEKHPDEVQQNITDVTESPMVFHWKDTEEALARALPQAYGLCSREVQLGQPALPTIALAMQQFDAGMPSRELRTTANNIYAVVKGSGRSVIDGIKLDWNVGDVIAVPAWRSFQHIASEQAVLFKVSDEPVMRALGFMRTELA
jgi:gentisate 1,2-dioxygenase